MKLSDREGVEHYLGELKKLQAAKEAIARGPTIARVSFSAGDDLVSGDAGPFVLIKIQEWLEFSSVLAACQRSLDSDIAAITSHLNILGVSVDA